jgi:trans-aconitate 2-methyltransferase
MTSDWLPELYLKFADERSRPARDLLAQMPLQNPRVIYDLGCGPGNSTAFLDTTFPVTEIIGIDSSETMLAKARVTLPKRQFFKANLVQWIPPKTADLLFSKPCGRDVAASARLAHRRCSCGANARQS